MNQDQQVGMGDDRNCLEGLFNGDPKLAQLNLLPHVWVSRAPTAGHTEGSWEGTKLLSVIMVSTLIALSVVFLGSNNHICTLHFQQGDQLVLRSGARKMPTCPCTQVMVLEASMALTMLGTFRLLDSLTQIS